MGLLARGIALPLVLMLPVGLAADRMALRAARIDLPPLVLWAWDRADDLRFLDVQDTAVAYLAATITLRGEDVLVQPRRNPLTLPEGTARVAVAHVETDRAAPPALNAAQLRRFVDVLAAIHGDASHHAFQVDFEALSSQRRFLIDALAALRRRLPDTAISATALASWCLNEGWTAALAADEVVPMLFRMGPNGRRVRAHFADGGDFKGAACRTSIGVATDELPAVLPAGRRVYAFSPRHWTADAYHTVRARMKQWSRASLSD
jgi:hypothetical protein